MTDQINLGDEDEDAAELEAVERLTKELLTMVSRHLNQSEVSVGLAQCAIVRAMARLCVLSLVGACGHYGTYASQKEFAEEMSKAFAESIGAAFLLGLPTQEARH